MAKRYLTFGELIWTLSEKVEVYDTQDHKLCSKQLPTYYRKNKKFANRVVWSVVPCFENDGIHLKSWYQVVVYTEDDDRYPREDMASDMVSLLETLAKDSEQNGDGKGAYYYRSAIPFIKAYYGIKGESK